MFRFVSRRVLLSQPTTCSTNVSHGTSVSYHSLFFRNPFSSTVSDEKEEESSTVSYLINTCGLSSDAAIRATKRISLRSTENSDSVLSTLKDYGFSKTQISEVVAKLPNILYLDPDKIIKPKFDYLKSSGFTAIEVNKLIMRSPSILTTSLERRIIPGVSLLMEILPSKGDVIKVLGFTNQLFNLEHAANIATLKKYGVSEEVIMKILTCHPRSLMRNPERFEEVVKKVKDMGLNPKKRMFAYGVGVMSYTSESTWKKKVALYKSFGWSDHDLAVAFQKQPKIITMSEEVVRKKLDFLLTNLGYDAKFLSARPTLVMVSFERKLRPRWPVLQILISRGSISKTTKPTALFALSHKKFFENYVARYKDDLPEVVKAYQNAMATAMRGMDSENSKMPRVPKYGFNPSISFE